MGNFKILLVVLVILLLISLAAAFTWANMKKGNVDDLILAVQEGNLQKVRVLLNQGDLDVDTLIEGNATLLMRAVALNYEDIARLLIEKGANVNAHSIGEHTSVLTIACGPYKTIIVSEQNGVRGFKSNDLPANPRLIRYLIERGANVNPLKGAQPLMIAVTRQEAEVVKILIENGANVTYIHGIKGDGGYSILDRAEFPKNHAIYDMLIKAGAK